VKESVLFVDGISVTILRKAIRNFHLRILPPLGLVRVSAPLRMTDESIRNLIQQKFEWIKNNQSRMAIRYSQDKSEFSDGEEIRIFGQTVVVRLIEQRGPLHVELMGSILSVRIRPGASKVEREKVVSLWFRSELRHVLQPLIEKWEGEIGVKADHWSIKKMKTRWGSCNIRHKRIWFSLELIKKPLDCIESIVIHELLHLVERGHGPRSVALMDHYSPDWKALRVLLNS